MRQQAQPSVLTSAWLVARCLPSTSARLPLRRGRCARPCATVGARLGAAAPRYDAGPVRARLAPLGDPLARTGALLCAEVAIGETISMTLFRAGRRAAIEPLTRAALESILRDEVRHLLLGWEGLAALWPLLDPARRAALQGEATGAPAACEQTIALPKLHRLEAGEPFDLACAELGCWRPRPGSRHSTRRSSSWWCRTSIASASTARAPGATVIALNPRDHPTASRGEWEDLLGGHQGLLRHLLSVPSACSRRTSRCT